MGKRRRAREMAMQMLYQYELGGTPLNRIFESYDLESYLEEAEEPVEGEPGELEAKGRDLRSRAKKSFEYAQSLVEGTLNQRAMIDELISKFAENWRLERMPTIDRNILRLAIYEMLHESSVPKVVIVDEAIELAKKFGSENSGRFVNGLLDGVLQSHLASSAVTGSSV